MRFLLLKTLAAAACLLAAAPHAKADPHALSASADPFDSSGPYIVSVSEPSPLTGTDLRTYTIDIANPGAESLELVVIATHVWVADSSKFYEQPPVPGTPNLWRRTGFPATSDTGFDAPHYLHAGSIAGLPLLRTGAPVLGFSAPVAYTIDTDARIAAWPAGVVAPGAEATITVRLDPRGYSGRRQVAFALATRAPIAENLVCNTTCPDLDADHHAYCNPSDHCEYARTWPEEPWHRDAVWVHQPPAIADFGSASLLRPASEKPLSSVQFQRGFFLARHEVNVRTYSACVASGLCGPATFTTDTPPGVIHSDPDFPQNALSRSMAMVVCSFLDARLPTETEWEYGARGAMSLQSFPHGFTAPECITQAIFDSGGPGCGTGSAAPTGPTQRPAGRSPSGLFDMAGNLAEHVEDCWSNNHEGNPLDGTARPTSTCPNMNFYVARGGSFLSPVADIEVTARPALDFMERASFMGVRCARSMDTTPPEFTITPTDPSTVTIPTAERVFRVTASEPVGDLDPAFISVSNAVLVDVVRVGPATFDIHVFADYGVTGSLLVAIAAGAVVDRSGNANTLPASAWLTLDTRPATWTITLISGPGADGVVRTTFTFSFAFSEAPVGWSIDRIMIDGGSITSTRQNRGVLEYTVTPFPDLLGFVTVTLDTEGIVSTTGKPYTGAPLVLPVDTLTPAAPTIDPVTGDNIIDAAEKANGITLAGNGGRAGFQVRVSLAPGATFPLENGDTAIVTSARRWSLALSPADIAAGLESSPEPGRLVISATQFNGDVAGPTVQRIVCVVAPETCNGIDDDCDGWIDAADADYQPPLCALQEGVCAGARNGAAVSCVDGVPVTACSAETYALHAPGVWLAAGESCDGLDNDCDGATDEDFGLGQSCFEGLGACRAEGQRVCAAGGGSRCDAVVGAPTGETCNGVDDDCDGLVDNVVGGVAGSACGGLETEILSGPPAVTAAREATFTYRNPWASEPASAGVFECRVNAGPWYACNGGTATIGGLGEGTQAFQVRAVGAGGVVDPTPAVWTWLVGCVPSAEVCDGRDNDCDGLVDAADPDFVREKCELQAGVCGGAMKPANRCVTVGGATFWSACNGSDYTAHAALRGLVFESSDTRCDGVDNDCDGATDEDFIGEETTCGVGGCAGSVGQTVCEAGGRIGTRCDAFAGARAETCNGRDDDCDGLVDEGLVPDNACATGYAACADGEAVCIATDDDVPPVCVDDVAVTWVGKQVVLAPLDNDRGRGLEVVAVGPFEGGEAKRLDAFSVLVAPAGDTAGVLRVPYVARDLAGREAGAVIVVTVKRPETPFEVEESTLVCEGDEASVAVKVKGGSGSWEVDGVPVEADSSHLVAPTQPLKLVVEDSGTGETRVIAGVAMCPYEETGLKAVADRFEVVANGVGSYDVVANDIGVGLEVEGVAGARFGTVSVTADRRSVAYVPTPGVSGVDRFVYKLKDAAGRATVGEVGVLILPRALDLRDDRALTAAGEPVRIEVLKNDLGVAGGTALRLDEEPRHGAAFRTADGAFIYTPARGFVGEDRFTYAAGAGEGLSRATVAVTVTDGGCLAVRLEDVVATCSDDGGHFTVAAKIVGGSGYYDIHTAGEYRLTPLTRAEEAVGGGVAPEGGVDATVVAGPFVAGKAARLQVIDKADVAAGRTCKGAFASAAVACAETPLQAANGTVYAVAGQPVLVNPRDHVSGVGVAVTTVGSVPGGAVDLGLGVHQVEKADTELWYAVVDAFGEQAGGIVRVVEKPLDLSICKDFSVHDLNGTCSADGATVTWRFAVQGGSKSYAIGGEKHGGGEVVRVLPATVDLALVVEDLGLPACGALTVVGRERCGPMPKGAVADAVAVEIDGEASFEPLLNDIGDGLAVVAITPPSAGTLTPAGAGRWIFAAPPGFGGVIATRYTVRDAGGVETTADIVFFVAARAETRPGCAFCALTGRDDRLDLGVGDVGVLDLRQNDDGAGLQLVGFKGASRNGLALDGQRLVVTGRAETDGDRFEAVVRDRYGFTARTTALLRVGPATRCLAGAGRVVAERAYGCGGGFVVEDFNSGADFGVGLAAVGAGRVVKAFALGAAVPSWTLAPGSYDIQSFSWRRGGLDTAPRAGQLWAPEAWACAAVSAPVAWEELTPIGLDVTAVCEPGYGFFLDFDITGGAPARGLGNYTLDVSPPPPWQAGQFVRVTASDGTGCGAFATAVIPSVSCGGNP